MRSIFRLFWPVLFILPPKRNLKCRRRSEILKIPARKLFFSNSSFAEFEQSMFLSPLRGVEPNIQDQGLAFHTHDIWTGLSVFYRSYIQHFDSCSPACFSPSLRMDMLHQFACTVCKFLAGAYRSWRGGRSSLSGTEARPGSYPFSFWQKGQVDGAPQLSSQVGHWPLTALPSGNWSFALRRLRLYPTVH